jgi:catechol 2,3-dioxygenase-like lactoylglutathione lyase family enzyme
MIGDGMKLRLLPALVLLALPVMAQLPAPNKMGVSAGHDVLRAKDVAAANAFWQTLGAQPATFAERLNLMKFPGVLILEIGNAPAQGKGKAAPTTPPPPPAELLGSEGSSLDFIGFSVKDLKGSLAKWAAAGIHPMAGGSSKQVYVLSPDKIKVRITENKSQAEPIVADTIKMMVPNVAEAQAWYAKNFGAEMVKRGGETVAAIPGSNILFEQAKGPVAPSKGRAFDRIGIEVVGLEAFCKKLEAAGVHFDSPYRYTESMKAAFAVFQDPWGTLIELSEGLSAVK